MQLEHEISMAENAFKKKIPKKKSDAVSLAKKNKTKNRQRRRVGGRSHFTGPNPKNCLNYSWSHFQVSAHTHTHTHTHWGACGRLLLAPCLRNDAADITRRHATGFVTRKINRKKKQTNTNDAGDDRKEGDGRNCCCCCCCCWCFIAVGCFRCYRYRQPMKTKEKETYRSSRLNPPSLLFKANESHSIMIPIILRIE